MGFFTQRCPNCSKSISKDADHCSHCGCPASNTWASCHQCGSSVGTESRFCWKCGTEQRADQRKAFYGDRWHRSPTDFAVRIELAVPEKTLHHGLQVDEGTLALFFQNGRFVGSLAPGYHAFDTFAQRLFGTDKGKQAHAILIDTQAAEVDFAIEGIRTAKQVPVNVRMRLLFQVTDAKLFADRFFKDASTFTTADLTARFTGDVSEALQIALQPRPLDEIASEVRTRELIEGEVVKSLQTVLGDHGLRIVGVRLADFSGPAMDTLREKLGKISELNRENELNREMRDALREEKISAFRDEEDLRDYYEKITQEYGFKAAERGEEQRRFTQASEHRLGLEALRHDYDLRRAEIVNRLDEQKLRHQAEMADVQHELEINQRKFTQDIGQQEVRFDVGQKQQVRQSDTDLEIAKRGIEALKLVKEAKHEARIKEEALNTQLEADRLSIRGGANMQALLASIDGPQADRLLKLAEIEMRKGLSAEQSLALVAEKSPEIAPAVAAAIKARQPAPPVNPPASNDGV